MQPKRKRGAGTCCCNTHMLATAHGEESPDTATGAIFGLTCTYSVCTKKNDFSHHCLCPLQPSTPITMALSPQPNISSSFCVSTCSPSFPPPPYQPRMAATNGTAKRNMPPSPIPFTTRQIACRPGAACSVRRINHPVPSGGNTATINQLIVDTIQTCDAHPSATNLTFSQGSLD